MTTADSHIWHAYYLQYEDHNSIAVSDRPRSDATFRLRQYPFMIFGNGQVGTPSVERARFVTQLQLNGGKAFWSERKPDKYAHFRASAPASAKSVTVRPFEGLFQRTGLPGQGATEVPANRDDPS